MAAPSRQVAESSPYYETMKKKEVEVLFCYESYDELVLMQLQQFDKKKMTSVEKEFREQSAKSSDDDKATDAEGKSDCIGRDLNCITLLCKFALRERYL